MDSFERLRLEMVEDQLVSRGIKEPKVLAVFRRVPRHEFIPAQYRAAAYDDFPLPIGGEQTISQPYIVALITEMMEISKEDKILEIGTGSGYHTAILAELCRRVYTMERIESLSLGAREVLVKLGYTNIEFVSGDGTEGYLEAAPYNRIVVGAGCPDVPPPLLEQLAEGGKLLVPVGDRYLQRLTVVTKNQGKISREKTIDCRFVPLIGKYGWQD
ncbi:MAG: protein-L-isoaspartate(D-aspartate) O-methyltransferase [Candidatus Margulisiibacteriota bacterium]|jgi:protein-L-isoaspartate(D-aspartate) O-methyltransferase